MTESEVLIVGAGPVGLTLAIDLAWRGIEVTVVETRAPAAAPDPKCNHVAARTMEIFRRLGLAEKVRNAGLPADHPHDISYRTTFTGQELTRIPIPCRRDRFTRKDGPDCNWPTPEPPHRINQIFLEPILFEHAAAQSRIDIINRTSVEDVVVEGDGARLSLRDFESVDRDASIRTILGVGPDFQYEILSREDWFGRRLIANKFRDRCAFIAGDAAHIWVPYAGYGMNAGIADAMNLSWLIAAHLNGWAPYSILDAYEAERWPITSQASRFAMSHAEAEIRRRGAIPDEIDDEGPHGELARKEIGRLTYEINVQQYACAGLNFGSYYDRSPIIVYDGAEHPPYTMDSYTPSTVPGCRTPHVWLENGVSLYDAMGPEFTLLRFDSALDVSALQSAAHSRRLPLKVLEVPKTSAANVYSNGLVLSRPDQHVAWRGDSLPADALALIDRVRGAASEKLANSELVKLSIG